MNEHEIIVAAKSSAVLTQVSGGATVFAGLNVAEWGTLLGVIVGLLGMVIGLILQWYFSNEKLKLQRQLYAKIQHPDQDIDTGKGEL